MNAIQAVFAALVGVVFGSGSAAFLAGSLVVTEPGIDEVQIEADAAVAVAYAQLCHELETPVVEEPAPEPKPEEKPYEVEHDGRLWRWVDGAWLIRDEDSGKWRPYVQPKREEPPEEEFYLRPRRGRGLLFP